MNMPLEPITIEKTKMREALQKFLFEKDGDKFERTHYLEANTHFPNIERFWQNFVIPLTNRFSIAPGSSRIRFREGIDPILQYISGANYSLFVHLVSARSAFANWSDLSLDTVYTRLASSCDVFEALAIKCHILICECSSMKSHSVEELTKEEFLSKAESYYDENYSKLKEYYLSIGKKVPPINIPTKTSILDEFLAASPDRKIYHTTAGHIRSFRNAIVHDVRVGSLIENEKMLVPKPQSLHKYRNWFEVEHASGNPEVVARDFCEAKELCDNHITDLTKAINGLYGFILGRFIEEFYSTERAKLRDIFGIRFGENESPSTNLTPPAAMTELSHSFETKNTSTKVDGVSGQYPFSSNRSL